jgi:hypothetical protein
MVLQFLGRDGFSKWRTCDKHEIIDLPAPSPSTLVVKFSPPNDHHRHQTEACVLLSHLCKNDVGRKASPGGALLLGVCVR